MTSTEERPDYSIPPGQTRLAYLRRTASFSLNDTTEIVDVVKYTAKQVVCRVGKGEVRFNLEDGSERGGEYGSRVAVLTSEILERIEHSRIEGQIRHRARLVGEKMQKLANGDRRRLPLEEMKAIRLALQEMDEKATLLLAVKESDE